MSMDQKTLQSLSAENLSEYLWRRLRYEGPMDPPLDRRTRVEPPEDFLLRTFQQTGDRAFRERLTESVEDNLTRVLALIASEGVSSATAEQLASLAFLSSAIGDAKLGYTLYLSAVALLSSRAPSSPSLNVALFHVLGAVADLQNDARLTPFWETLWERAKAGELRAIAYYGLVRADSTRALELLDELVADERIDLPVAAWSLATEAPGIFDMAKAAASLSSEHRARLRSALIAAGADDDLLQDFDLHSEPNIIASGFDFGIPDPADLHLAYEPPELAAA